METAATLANAPAPQNPRSPARRSDLQARGHRRQEERGDGSRIAEL